MRQKGNLAVDQRDKSGLEPYKSWPVQYSLTHSCCCRPFVLKPATNRRAGDGGNSSCTGSGQSISSVSTCSEEKKDPKPRVAILSAEMLVHPQSSTGPRCPPPLLCASERTSFRRPDRTTNGGETLPTYFYLLVNTVLGAGPSRLPFSFPHRHTNAPANSPRQWAEEPREGSRTKSQTPATRWSRS